MAGKTTEEAEEVLTGPCRPRGRRGRPERLKDQLRSLGINCKSPNKGPRRAVQAVDLYNQMKVG
jgi:hypothetical protein